MQRRKARLAVLLALSAALITLAPIDTARAQRVGGGAPGGGVSGGGAPGTAFTAAPCVLPLPPGLAVGKNVVCGYVAAPVEHARPFGPALRIPVTVIKHQGAGPAGDPVIFFTGGPGQTTESVLAPVFTLFGPIVLPHHDLILFDQRGTGVVQPALDCPEAVAQVRLSGPKPQSRAQDQQQQAAALGLCANRFLRQGVDLPAYNTYENAADVNSIRVALGYAHLILFGTSYGSLLAQEVARDYPQGVSAVYLDSVAPTAFDVFTLFVPSVDRSLRLVFTGCAVDPACNRAYPHLRATFSRVIARLNATPLILRADVPATGRRDTVAVTGDRLLGLLFQLLYNAQATRIIPALLASIDQGNTALLSRLEAASVATPESGDSSAMYLSVVCGDGLTHTQARIDALSRDALPEWTRYFGATVRYGKGITGECLRWPTAGATPLVRQPVRSAIPTLVFEGYHDPVTPPPYGQAVARNLTNGYYYEFPNSGHSTLGQTGQCGVRILSAFLADPTRRPAAPCIAALTDITYLTPRDLARGTLAATVHAVASIALY